MIRLFLAGLLALASGGPLCADEGPKNPAPSLQRTIHEAENLSLNKDRLLACGVLWRNLKKANKSDGKVLREKLLQLSRYYYTDKGFQTFLAGKDFFLKEKYQDALDKFLEADDLEAGNVEVLHYLTLSQLWLKKNDQAEANNKRALQMCPIDLETQRDQLTVQISQEKWSEAIATAESLTREYNDNSAQTLQNWGIALLKSDMKSEAKKILDQALQRNPQSPETYYWLSEAKVDGESTKLLTKYIELCKKRKQSLNQTPLTTEREINACIHLQEAEKRTGT